MQTKSRTLIASLIVLLIWLLIIVGGGFLQSRGQQQSLDASVQRPVIAYFVAPLFLLAIVAARRWGKSVGLKPADHGRSWRLIWLPMIFVVIFLSAGLLLGSLPLTTVLVILLNTLLVGFSEELMFRGVLFNGLRSRLTIWLAIWATTTIFGLVHSLNGFMTGDFPGAFTQAFSAALSGVWFMALRLRTNSLYPSMLVHGLWDFSVFMMVSATGLSQPHTPVGTTPPASDGVSHLLLVILLDLPLVAYGLWLLRGIGKSGGEEPTLKVRSST